MKNEVLSMVTELTDFYVNSAVQSVMDKLPDDIGKEEFQSELENIARQGISSVLNGQAFENELKKGVMCAARWSATHYTERILTTIADKMPSGAGQEIVHGELQKLVKNGISEICSGADMDAVIGNVEACFSYKTKEFLKEESKKIGADWIDSIAGGFKEKGRGKGRSRTNRRIDNISGHLKNHLFANIGRNFDELWGGNKNLPTALGDIVADTATNAVIDIAQEQAVKMGNDFLKSATQNIQKELVSRIENKSLKKLANKGLKEISNLDGVLEFAQDAKAIGGYIEKFLDGEINRADLMQNISDKAANSVSVAVEKVATVLAFETGTAAPIIGYIAGYVAGNLIREAVAPFVNAARKVKWAKERYEKIHELSEQAVRQMQEQRFLFEQETAKLFNNRQKLIDESIFALDQAVKTKNANVASAALDKISREFGNGNKLVTFEEFDDFIMNGKEELYW